MSKQGEHGITWTDETWNPIRGCSRVSEGCRNCYAERVAARFRGARQPYEGLARMTPSGPRWTGQVRLVEEHLLDPLRWTRPRRVVVNSMSDLFHPAISDEHLDRIFAVMADAARHTFQVLTKRPARMLAYLSPDNPRYTARRVFDLTRGPTGKFDCDIYWPLSNVWLGVSVEDQVTADERIPLLLETPAAVRWVSAEPLLGPLDLRPYLEPECNCVGPETHGPRCDQNALDWLVVGGESGPGARPMHPDWARSLRDQCIAAGVPFHFKQWGEWAPNDHCGRNRKRTDPRHTCATTPRPEPGHMGVMFRCGKLGAGRLLDERTWDEFPKVTA